MILVHFIYPHSSPSSSFLPLASPLYKPGEDGQKVSFHICLSLSSEVFQTKVLVQHRTMYSNVPIQILVEDDPFNAPDATKVAKTIIVKIPRDCSFKTMAQKIADQYPGIMHRVVMLYYYAKNGKKQDTNIPDSLSLFRKFLLFQRSLTFFSFLQA